MKSRLKSFAAMFVVLASAMAMLLVSCSGSKQSPAQDTRKDEVLSLQQQVLLKQFGQPDAFLVAFESHDGDGASQPIRVETWQYHRNLTSFSFINGQFGGSKRIEQLADKAVTGAYKPDQFRAGMTIEQVRGELGQVEMAKVDIDELSFTTPLPKGLTLYYAPQIVLGFADNSLRYVQTVPCRPFDPRAEK